MLLVVKFGFQFVCLHLRCVQIDVARLIDHCRQAIAGYKVPKAVTFRDEPLPLSGAGKVLKTELRKPFWEGRERQVN